MPSQPDAPAGDRLLEVRDLAVEFPLRGRTVHAVSGVSFDVRRGETLGVVGESGCGKSTVARAILQIPSPTSGTVRFDARCPRAERRCAEEEPVMRDVGGGHWVACHFPLRSADGAGERRVEMEGVA